MMRALTFLPVNSVLIMAFLPQELLLLSISKDLSCKQDILGGSRYVSRKLYHHLPGGGWEKDSGVWVPHWTSLVPIAASCQELLTCGCRISCSGNCKCFRSVLPVLLYAAVTALNIKSFASYKTTTACILAHAQCTYI